MPVKVLIFVLAFSQVAFGSQDPREIWRNNRAVDTFFQKKVLEAHDQFTQLLIEQPYHPLYRFNMGTAFIGVEETKKAIKMYEEVLKMQPLPPEIEFASNFNLGVLYGTKENFNLDRALEHYQAALAITPDSQEVKNNIELLFQGKGGKGEGDGEQEPNEDNKDGKGDKKKEPQNFTNKPQGKPQKTPKNMSKSDVKKILEELKKQEQRIRAKQNNKKSKQRRDGNGKSW